MHTCASFKIENFHKALNVTPKSTKFLQAMSPLRVTLARDNGCAKKDQQKKSAS